ncbi:MAG TPA: hypothetical protein VEC57_04190 [Candidatus Limnocylindrales bacterium]|nr:hypothetical protein [Candidatus Limnocylindrales bacterium]
MQSGRSVISSSDSGAARAADPWAAVAVFLVACIYFAAFRPLERPLLLDAATWDYMAVELPRGLVPYRDVFLHKTPGTAFVGAVAAAVASAIGAEPVLGVHAFILLQGALAPALLFLLCRPCMERGAAVACSLSLLAYDQWVVAVLEGSQPKVPTLVFGLLCLVAAQRRKVAWSGILGGAAVLCWQPALCFLAGALMPLVARETTWPSRLRVTMRMAAMSLVPTVILLAWLALQGALQAFVDQAILFNVDYIQLKARTLPGTLRALGWNFADWEDVEMLMLPAVIAGLLLRPQRLPASLLLSTAIYFAMLFVSMQSWPDLILLGPGLAAIFGAGLHGLLRAALRPMAATVLALALVAAAAAPDARPKYRPGLDFTQQRARMRQLASEVGPHEPIIGVSVPEFFLHTGRRNGWMWPYLWFGVDAFAAAHTAGGFEGILRDLEASDPPMILLGRHWTGPLRARFEEWAAARYEVSEVKIFPHTQRPMRVYRRRSG